MTQRLELIKKIETIRGSRVICYLTLETAMWDLYKSYEEEFKNREEFRPHDELLNAAIPSFSTPPAPATPPTAAAPPGPPAPLNIPTPVELKTRLLFAMIEDSNLVSRYDLEKRYILWSFQGANAQMQELTESAGWVTAQQAAGGAKPAPAAKAAAPAGSGRAQPAKTSQKKR